MTNRARIEEEFNKLKYSKNIKIVKCDYVDGNIFKWKVAFEGMPSSPYEDGIFVIHIDLKNDYPNSRPWIYFDTKMFHPNIRESDGLVSLNLLYEWESSRTIEQVLYGFMEVMENPKVGCGYGEAAQKLLEKDRNEFFKKVEEYTYRYAFDDV